MDANEKTPVRSLEPKHLCPVCSQVVPVIWAENGTSGRWLYRLLAHNTRMVADSGLEYSVLCNGSLEAIDDEPPPMGLKNG